MSSTVDGLVSGMDTTSVINQLMQVEAATQTRLKAKISTAQTAVSSYQSVNSKLSALKSAADSLGQLSTWRGIKASSTSSTVTATALTGTNGNAGTTTFDVARLAKNQITTAKVDTSADITSEGQISITIGSGDPVDIALTDKTADGVAKAINAAGIGVKATVITTGGSSNIIQFSGTKTGAANSFTVTGLDNLGSSLTNVTEAQDARLDIGGGDANEQGGGYSVTSSTNTFTTLMPGVSITATKEGETNVTVQAVADVDGIADKFQALVDAANATLTEIGAQTAYDAGTKTGQPLTGDFTVRQMSQTILGSISHGLTYDDPDWVKPEDDPDAVAPKKTFPTLSAIGIELDSTGKLTFNRSAFKSAYADDASKIQEVGIAFGNEYETMAGSMSTNVSSVITGRKSEIDTINNQISAWDVRLTARRAALQKQYSNLEVALGKLKDQSNWLAGQLAGLS